MKINLSVPEAFTKTLEDLAESLKKSKSEVVREAITLYHHHVEARRAHDEMLQRRREACKTIDAWGKRYGVMYPKDWSAVQSIRKLRDTIRWEHGDKFE